jgi:HTH-type transcriptional regulator/antitoxin MqsA
MKMRSDTRIHPETGAVLRRDVRPMTLKYEGRQTVIDLPGWYPDDHGRNDDAILEGQDAQILDRAFNRLKAEADGLPTPDDIKRIRKRVKLSQRRAGEILGGGPRSFQKYESGEVVVSRPMANLLLLLDRDPSLLKELIRERAA